MKKKLIAIVASLAMVATLVPSVAFGASAQTKTASKAGITADLQPVAVATPNWKAVWNRIGGNDGSSVTILPHDGVTADYSNGVLKLSGTVPYIKNINNTAEDGSGTSMGLNYGYDLKNGNFVQIRTRIQNPLDGETGGWAIVSYSAEQGPTEGDRIFYDYKLITDDFGENDADKISDSVTRLNRTGQKYTVYYLTKKGQEAFDDALEGRPENRYGAEADKADIGDTFYAGTVEELNALLAGEDEKGTKYVIDSQEIAIDTSGLTLLTEQETKTYVTNKAGVQGFVDAVAAIKVNNGAVAAKFDETDKVDATYRTKTVEARAKYAGLTTAQKAIVDNAVKGSTEKKAYDNLLAAEKNVASYDQLPDVAALIASLPTAEKMDVTNEAQVKQVKDVEVAVNALTKGVQEVLLNDAGNEYLTSGQVAKYKKVLEMVNNAAAQAVIKAINELPTLPTTEFTDKVAIDAVFTPMADAEKAYKALTDGEKAAVSNYAVLSSYRNNYDRLMKAYVDPMWEDALEIKLSDETPLTEDEIALITELKAYVDGRYMDTAKIKDFDQDVYDALVDALDKIDKDAKSLANAEVTVAGADSIVYDGTKKTPELTVTIGGKEVPAEAYDAIYSDNKDAGEAIVTIIPKDESGYTGKKEATFTIKAAALTDAMVKNIANVTYTGKAIKPAISAASGVTYDVTYKNNTAVGKATATITGTGNYTGTITKTFIVKPAKEAISSLKAGKKSLTVAYKAQTGAKYRIVYSPAKGQAKAVNTTATKKTIKSLKAGKTYKVKVRAYKVVDGKTYNGTYSTVKKVKVK